MSIDINKTSAREIVSAVHRGDISAREIAESYLSVIENKNKDINAFLEVFDDVLTQAENIDKKKDKGVLAGLPIAVKDNILIKDRKASAASLILENYKAVYDATVVKKLKDSDVVFLGRTNMDEFAMGGSTENSAFGPTKNPFDHDRVPGGSSGGSASAVGALMAPVALGSDTGGSVRQPASFCGVVGLKPTYGRVSRFGLIAMASSLDQIGPITKNVDDAEFIFDQIIGKDKMDSTSVLPPVFSKKVPEKFKVGVPEGILDEGIDPEVKENFEKSLKVLEGIGHEIVSVPMPNLKYALSTYYIIMPAEVSSNLARFDGIRYGGKKTGDDLLSDYMKTRGQGFGKEARRRILLGTFVLSAGYYDAYYAKAVMVKNKIKDDYIKAFEKIDLIVTPTAPTPAFKIEEKIDDPLQMYLEDIFTVPANIAGIPAMSVPSGQTKSGLPIGFQFLAPHFREDYLFSIGKQFEQSLGV